MMFRNSPLSDQDYAKVSEQTMDSLTEYLESHLESLAHLDPASIDIEYSVRARSLSLSPFLSLCKHR